MILTLTLHPAVDVSLMTDQIIYDAEAQATDHDTPSDVEGMGAEAVQQKRGGPPGSVASRFVVFFDSDNFLVRPLATADLFRLSPSGQSGQSGESGQSGQSGESGPVEGRHLSGGGRGASERE